MRRHRQLAATFLGMAFIASGTYLLLGSLVTKPAPPAAPPTTKPTFVLPGTIYIAQRGALYTVKKGSITKLNLTPTTFWSHPAMSPDSTRLVVTGGDPRRSDLFLLTPAGGVIRQLTDNAAPEVAQNHWAFYSRFSSDGSTVFYSWDPKSTDATFRVDLAVYSLAIAGQAPPGQRWTEPDHFTGGDIAPQPLPGGGLLYAGYSATLEQKIASRIWFQPAPGAQGTPLTDLARDCGRPALSPAGDLLAMICSPAPDRTELVISPFKDGVIGAPLLTVDDQLAAAPSWSPDGKGVVYLAPGNGGIAFDLWWLPLNDPGQAAAAPAPTPTAPAPRGRRQVTTGLDLDAASAPAWAAA